MNRKMDLYGPPVHPSHYHSVHSNAYYPNLPTHQAPDPMFQYVQQAQHQTPFEYFTKQDQVTGWPDSMPQHPNFYPPPNPQPGFLDHNQGGKEQIDFDKMLSTVGQLANTVQQVSPVIKQVSAIIKTFR